MQQVNGAPYLKVECPGVHLENIRLADAVAIDTNYAVSGYELLSDTTYTGLDLPAHRALLPNSYPGVAIGQAWFPTGLDMKARGLSRVAYLSGTTTKGNNLGKLAQAVSAGATTLTVAFAGKTYPNVTVTMVGTTGGTMALGTYHYRHAARNRLGGPVLAGADQTVTLSGANNAVGINIDGLYDSVTGIAVEGITIYRGPVGGASGNYTTRYDVVPTGELTAWGGTGTGNNKRFPLRDYGTTVQPVGNYFAQGYTFPVAAQSGSFTPADESGWEPDTNYAVFVQTSWHTTWRATAQRRDGFDLEFGVPCPTGGGTINWMIARF